MMRVKSEIYENKDEMLQAKKVIIYIIIKFKKTQSVNHEVRMTNVDHLCS